MKRTIILMTALLLTVQLLAKERQWTLASPDGRLVAYISSDDVSIGYRIDYNNSTLLCPTSIDLDYSQGNKDHTSMTMRKATRRTIDETVASPFTRQAAMRNHCNELTLQFKEGLSLVFRAYDEGLAYRFAWDGKPGRVNKETVNYKFGGDWTATAPYVISFDSTRHEIQYSTSFENHYTTLPLSQLDPRRLCFLPLLIHADNGIKMCITESSLSDYPGLYLHGTGKSGLLVGEHAPLPSRVEQGGHNNLQLIVKEREDYIAEMDRSKHFPWRIMMVGTAEEIAMNNMSYLLGEPSKVQDQQRHLQALYRLRLALRHRVRNT